ncbi:hypothetical protein WQ57_07770 [Mesobacillus campisalis]|uniref:Uncharacterized protein n=1 Tax=Mesobacillus campisalis TaxID=1408103 RepID=A0A0M2SXR2_9BACI|nr:hypothetical protein [Mesobacillus campisalis]KKK38496.1 hypothetical protein WQ57_07770 [Mesobacillus campisalis]
MREHNADSFSVYIIAAAIVMFFAALPAGIFIVNLLQQTLFIRESQLFFETPRSAFMAFIITLMIVPIVMILLVFVKSRTHGKKSRILIAAASIMTLAAFGGMSYLSFTNYYYMDQNGFHYNKLWQLQEERYPWEKLTTISQINTSDGGTLKADKLIFSFGQDKVELDITPKLYNEMEPVIESLKSRGVTMETVVKEKRGE